MEQFNRTELNQEYEKHQRELATMFHTVAKALEIPVLDPTDTYIINVGCGSSPDNIALQAFADTTKGLLPIVGIDLAILGNETAKIRPGNELELIQGDAAKVIPEVVAKRGQPIVIVARNVDAMFMFGQLSKDFQDSHPELDTSWHEVFQRVYEALPEEGGYFVTTYKNNQEFVPLVSYMQDVGFIAFPIEIEKPDRRSIREKIRAAANFEIPHSTIEPDQYVMVGVKNISDSLLAKCQKQDPNFTRENIENEKEEAQRWKEAVQVQNRFDEVNKALAEAPRDISLKILLNFLMRQEINISDEQIEQLKALKDTPAKLIIKFRDLESLASSDVLPDHPAQKGSLWKRGIPGYQTRFALPQEGTISLSRGTVYEYPKKGVTPTSNNFIQTGEVVITELVGVFLTDRDLETVEMLIEINSKDNQ
jgi:hypothetical protein